MGVQLLASKVYSRPREERLGHRHPSVEAGFIQSPETRNNAIRITN